MVELLGFIRFCVKKIGSQNLETPLIMNFYLCQSTQVCIHLILHNGRYFLFMSLENILQRLQLGSLNSKLNFSYLLIGSLSHELFTPINHLVNATDSILKLIKQEKEISSVLREEVQMVRNITQGVMILVQNMLDFGRFMNRSLSVDIRTFNLKQEADYVAEIFKIKARRKKLDFIVGCPNITVSMDKDKLIGLIYIFLDNAMKYTRQGVVQLQLIEIAESELIRVSVIDTGVGIDESDLQKLSDILGNPYSDLRTTTAAGVGIGFRVAQVLLTYLGGGEMTLDVKSIKGSGTVVTFDVPKKSRTPADRSILVIQSKIDNTKSDKHEDGSEFKDGPDCQKDRKDQRCVTQISLSPIRLRSKNPEEKVQNNAIGSKLVIKQKANPNQVGFGKPLIDQMSPILTGRSIHKTSGRKISVKKLPLGMVDTQELGRDRGGATSPSKSGSPMNLLGAVSPYVTEHAPEKESKDNPREDETHSPFGGLGEKDISDLRPVALVVDDEILNLDFLQHHLESFGVEVYTAFDGELALELCHKLLILNKAVDVIFMDYNMPNMNGDECTKKLKDSRFAPILKDAKIVGLTAHRDEQIRSQCLEAGMDMVEYKPFRYEDIENILLKYNIIQSAESCEEPFS